MKADTKLIVVMWCQIFNGKYIAPSSNNSVGDHSRSRPVDKSRNLLVIPHMWLWPELCMQLTKVIFNILPPCVEAGVGWAGPPLHICLSLVFHII